MKFKSSFWRTRCSDSHLVLQVFLINLFDVTGTLSWSPIFICLILADVTGTLSWSPIFICHLFSLPMTSHVALSFWLILLNVTLATYVLFLTCAIICYYLYKFRETTDLLKFLSICCNFQNCLNTSFVGNHCLGFLTFKSSPFYYFFLTSCSVSQNTTVNC